MARIMTAGAKNAKEATINNGTLGGISIDGTPIIRVTSAIELIPGRYLSRVTISSCGRNLFEVRARAITRNVIKPNNNPTTSTFGTLGSGSR